MNIAEFSINKIALALKCKGLSEFINLKQIFEDTELNESSVCRDFRRTAKLENMQYINN